MAAATRALAGALLALAAAAAPLRADVDARCAALLARAEADPRLALERRDHDRTGTPLLVGSYEVPENRATGEGRQIRLALAILPALADEPAPDPVFILHGGPGAAATTLFRRQARGWLRERRDVVLVDQRGTGGSNPLTVAIPGDDGDLQGYLESYFQPAAFRAALPELEARADIAQYTTPNAVDDFDELRAALGYDRVNVRGGSYGTRAALVWMRRHPESIRTATLNGVQPISFLNPLPHAREAQEALDLIFDEVAADETYRAAFGDLRAVLAEVFERLEAEPAQVAVRHPVTGAESSVVLDRRAFAEGLRLQLYTLDSNRRLPRMLLRAHAGDYRELTEAAIAMGRGVRPIIAWGTLIAVTESEDLGRIDPAQIGPECAGTFLGETRIREQLAIAAFWPSGTVDEDFAQPVAVDVPTLILSGTHDPTTSPRWGAVAASHLPHSLHVVAPGGHGLLGPPFDRLERAFIEAGSVRGLDTTEIDALALPPLALPDPAAGGDR